MELVYPVTPGWPLLVQSVCWWRALAPSTSLILISGQERKCLNSLPASQHLRQLQRSQETGISPNRCTLASGQLSLGTRGSCWRYAGCRGTGPPMQIFSHEIMIDIHGVVGCPPVYLIYCILSTW